MYGKEFANRNKENTLPKCINNFLQCWKIVKKLSFQVPTAQVTFKICFLFCHPNNSLKPKDIL